MRGRAVVSNHAKPGNSTRSFCELHWPSVRASLMKSDWLLIQFGHVDALPDSSRHADADGLFREALLQFVAEARVAGATPVLVTPIPQYRFADGEVIDVHGRYPEVVREVANKFEVLLIDLTRLCTSEMLQLGERRARAWYMIDHDDHDVVHLSQTGARAVAAIVEADLKRAGLNP